VNCIIYGVRCVRYGYVAVTSGHDGVSIWVWECVNAVNSSGDKVRKACCHIARIGLSVIVDGWGSVLEEVLVVVFLAEVKCGMRVGG